METPIGRCSLCGGTVVKDLGPYWSVVPPVAHCQACGAVEAAPERVVPMTRPLPPNWPRYDTTTVYRNGSGLAHEPFREYWTV